MHIFKSLFLSAAMLVALTSAAPQQYQDVQIVRYENNNDGLGTYNFYYELSDGTTRQEEGHLNNQGTDQEALVVTGSYSWIAPDGQRYTVNFVADENGYRPEGAHLPKAPKSPATGGGFAYAAALPPEALISLVG